MFNDLLAMGAGGEGGIEMEICGDKYTPPYEYAIINTKTGVIKSASLPVAGGGSLSGDLLKVENTGNHLFTFSAINNAYLYRIGSDDAQHIHSFGQNGTFTVSSNYQINPTMIATREPLTI